MNQIEFYLYVRAHDKRINIDPMMTLLCELARLNKDRIEVLNEEKFLWEKTCSDELRRSFHTLKLARSIVSLKLANVRIAAMLAVYVGMKQ